MGHGSPTMGPVVARMAGPSSFADTARSVFLEGVRKVVLPHGNEEA
jgi:hypothetical protein